MKIEISLSEADKKELVQRVISAVIEEMIEHHDSRLRTKALTVAQVAKLINYHPGTVRSFIRKGRKARNGKVIALPAIELTFKEYRILSDDLDRWLAKF